MTDDDSLARLLASLEEIAAEDAMAAHDTPPGFHFIAGEDLSEWYLGTREPAAECRVMLSDDGSSAELRRLAAGEYCNPYHVVADGESVWELPGGDGPWELTIERPGSPVLHGTFAPPRAI